MTAQTQPEALRLAAWLNEGAWHNITLGDVNAAGRELRRQHARIAELEAEKANLRDALLDIASGEIMRSHCTGPHCTEELGVATADELASRASGALDWDDRVAEPPTQLRKKRQPLSPLEAIKLGMKADDECRKHARGTTNWACAMTRFYEAAHNITGEPA